MSDDPSLRFSELDPDFSTNRQSRRPEIVRPADEIGLREIIRTHRRIEPVGLVNELPDEVGTRNPASEPSNDRPERMIDRRIELEDSRAFRLDELPERPIPLDRIADHSEAERRKPEPLVGHELPASVSDVISLRLKSHRKKLVAQCERVEKSLPARLRYVFEDEALRLLSDEIRHFSVP